ncbi:hypothetical protein PC121_g9868 [Phytophthora cactorum]|nr:hypothetical protein PC120_g7748 [Phytophthora cactorum]KAG3069314.1 hypothetical protein PC121_g9868 [Phytophthora cactorum]KAG4057585.1 hypothetical protein PC123_g7433 [Phytophthora cactorum]
MAQAKDNRAPETIAKMDVTKAREMKSNGRLA